MRIVQGIVLALFAAVIVLVVEPSDNFAQPPGKKGGGKASGPLFTASGSRPLHDLWIPPALEGKSFDLTLGKSSKSYWSKPTATYSFNQNEFWGPTLIFNQGDTVQLKVKNELGEASSVHWHGLHLPAAMDGGPHQSIEPGGTWTASFAVKNSASTFWYHPHAHGTTQKQITNGAGGFIIVKDPIEAKLALPRTYGVDDIPLVFTSRRFASEEAFSSIGDSDKYGDYLLTNGTLDAKVSLPAQFVRLRLLNAEIERGYDFGFSDGRVFYVIATDGGLTDKPIPVKRMKLMVGERVELLVDLSGDKIGSTLDLMTYNARQPFGFPGGEPGSGRPNGSLLNAKEFRLLHIDVAAPTAAAITKLPETLAENHFPTEADVKQRRTLRIVRFGPPEREFAFDSKYFDMNTINFAVKLGDVEAWTISNDQTFGHSFHIHDIQFKIIKRSDGPVPDYEQGWKDTVYVPRGASVTFVARFDDFASDVDPFMYHCHMSNHEDGGLMGQFLVVKDPESLKKDSSGKMAFRSRLEHPLTPDLIAAAERQARTQAPPFKATDLNGQTLRLVTLTEKKPLVLFFIERDCPCSKDAAPLFDRLQTEYGDACTVVGVINAEKSIAREWAKQVGPHFAIIADPDLTIIDAYGAERSVYTTIVEPGGKIAKTFPGYSVDMLTELASTIARLGQTKERPLSFEGAPKKLVGGCPMRTP